MFACDNISVRGGAAAGAGAAVVGTGATRPSARNHTEILVAYFIVLH